MTRLFSFWLLAPGFWLLLLTSSTGCSGTVHPPVNPSDPVTIYVADYGRHSSIVLPAKDGGYVEWGFGDWNWFALGDTKWNVALAAMIWSPQSCFGRRAVPAPENDDALAKTLEADRVIHLQVPSERADKLMDNLNRRFDKHADTKMYSDYSKMDQVKDSEHYWAMNNCNHLTMRWLRKLDCQVDGFGIMSHFTLAK